MGANDLTLLDRRIAARHAAIAPDMTDEAFFDLFVAEQLLKDFQPNIDGLLYGIVDGSGDCGIDGFYTFVNDQQLLPGTLLGTTGRNPRVDCVIFQCKTSQGFAESVIEKLDFHLPKLLQFDRDEAALSAYTNPRLLELTRALLQTCSDLAPVNPMITFWIYYATRGDQVHPNAIAKAEAVPKTLRKLFPGSLSTFNFLDASQLLTHAQDSAATNRSLAIAEGPLSSEAGMGEGYVCLVRLHEYFEFIRNEDGSLNGSLFEANVRDHEGSTDVNRSIHETLSDSSDPEDFWWLNNGITIVAPTVQQMGKRLHLVDPQVVNGLQTSNEIYRHFSAGGVGGERHLLVRVVSARDDLVRDRIIRATNSQNQLPGSALRATDRLQHNIEEYFGSHGFFYDRRKNYYANQGRKIDRIVSMESVGQAVAACLLRSPSVARGRYASMLEDDLYSQLFSEQYSLNMYFNCVLLIRRVRESLQTHQVMKGGDIDDWVFHVATTAAMLRTAKVHPKHGDLANADFMSIPLARFTDLLPVVAREYQRALSRSNYVPYSVVSTDKHIADSLVKRVESMVVSSRWRKWPAEAIDEDSGILTSDVFYRGPRRTG